MAQEQRRKGSGRRTFWLITVLFLMILGAVGVSSYYLIRDASVVMFRDLEHNLGSKAQNKTAAITVWFGGLKNSVHLFADTDMFRLFTAEAFRVHVVGGQAHPGGESPLPPKVEEEVNADEILDPSTSEQSRADQDHKKLRTSLPLMNKQLRHFSLGLGLLGARVIEQTDEVLLTTDSTLPPLSSSEAQVVKEVLQEGKARILPVESTSDGLVMCMVHPVFPPAYMEFPVDKAVAALVLHIPVTAPLSSFLGREKRTMGMRLLQYPMVQTEALQELLPATGNIRNLPGWFAKYGQALGLEKRPLPNGAEVFSLAVHVPDLPWLVAEEAKASEAEALYVRFRNTVLLGAGAAVATAGLLLCFVWWLIVGRSERAFAKEVQELYQAVNDQKQLLDGINSALADGVVMTDGNGRIKFTNMSFARMVGHSPSSLLGLEASALVSPESAERIAANRSHVLTTAKGRIYNDMLIMRGRRRHFQIACSPYRDQDGNVTGTVSVYRDTTQMVEAQETSQRMVRQTINVLMRAIEAVDPYLCGHSSHTGFLASCLAQKLGMSTADRDTVRTAATLSQIGMLRLPPDLLRKSGMLTQEERKLLEKHVEYACSLLAGFDFGLPIQDTIAQMHEYLDGSGYPMGLKGDAIGMHARILAISNAFCAMVRPRSYRQAKDIQEVLLILSASPPKYDPHAVQALSEFLHSDKGRNFLMELRGSGARSATGGRA